jgi:hypothetical protein
MRRLWLVFSDLEKGISKVRPYHEITDIRELQPGQPLRGVGRGATAFYGVQGGWSGIATGYLLICLVSNIEYSKAMKIHRMWKLSQLNKDISQVHKVMTMLKKKRSINYLKKIVGRKFYMFAFTWKHGS